jgi:hypothetical protein
MTACLPDGRRDAAAKVPQAQSHGVGRCHPIGADMKAQAVALSATDKSVTISKA